MPKTRTGEVRACLECGKEMYLSPSELSKRKYCSRECQSAAIERGNQRACLRCGVAFQWRSGIVGKYCNWKCYQASRQRSQACLLCQKPLLPTQLRYCSHACRDKAKITLQQKPCEQCGVTMQVEAKLLASKRYCSKACHNESKRLKGPGARIRRQDGYIQIYYPTHPDASKQGLVLEHRLVAQEKYGRRILRTEHVHHINGIRDDNRPENLEIVSPSHHAGVSNRQGQAQRRAARAELEEYRRRFGPLG